MTLTVRDLIAALERFDPDLPVAYRLHSEHRLLALGDLTVETLQPPRPDGWVHRSWPGAERRTYLVFPGN